jgi:hypothetical protein
MNIKSLLIGSAAALAAATGAQAADAIIAAEPEPMEYVRVCDAFGTGYFYIPGTETCLQISGYVRFQTSFLQDALTTDGEIEDGYRTFTRGYISLDTKSDTELGTLTGHIDIQADSSRSRNANGRYSGVINGVEFDERVDAILDSNRFDGVFVDGAWVELGGFKAGYFKNFWDTDIAGETDELDNGTLGNAVSYTYDAGAFKASAALETLSNSENGRFSDLSDDWGVSGLVSGSFGPASIDFLASYDFDAEETALRSIASADIGPGALQVAGIWSSGPNRYWGASEWSVAASYAAKINDKFTITPGFQYFGGFGIRNAEEFRNDDAWRAGVTLDYEIVQDFNSRVSVQYNDIEGAPLDRWSGFVRLERSF